MKVQINELKGDHLFDVLGILGELEIEQEVEKLLVQNVDNDVDKKIVELKDHKKKAPTKKQIEEKQVEKLEKDREEAKEKAALSARLITKLVRKAPELKGKINPLLASAANKDVSVIEELSFKEYTSLLKDFFMEIKDELTDFFSSMQSSSNNETESTG